MNELFDKDILEEGAAEMTYKEAQRISDYGEAFLKYLEKLRSKPLQLKLLVSYINGLSKVAAHIAEQIKQENKNE